MKNLILAPFALLLFLTSAQSSPASQDPVHWAPPELERAVSVRNGRTGETLTFAQLLDALAKVDAVFLGEIHTDETTHRAQLGIYEGLVARREGKVVLAMEMFDRAAQTALNAYIAGESSEDEFLAVSRPWGNYETAYRPLVEAAKANGLPVVGSNFPRALSRPLAMLGDDASFDGFDEKDRANVPAQLYANTPDYWRRYDNGIRSHIGMMGGPGEDKERLYSTQSLWDNSMGEACAIALDEHVGSSVLHINGGFHSAYWSGTVRQLQLRKPDCRILTVDLVPVANPSVADLSGVPVADYVVFVEARATDRNEGTYSVSAQRSLKYTLHMPEGLAPGVDVPLLIWFADHGLKAEDGIALWRSRLGSECAIAVIESPYREEQQDLVEGGRWYWPDSFASDLGMIHGATQRMWGYVLRHYPIDPTRVCVAGEGTGATVVASIGLLDESMNATAVAISPRHYAKLKDLSLPLPELRDAKVAPTKSLRLFVNQRDESWWSSELAEYSAVGLESSLALLAQDPWLVEDERESALRDGLGLSQPEARTAKRGHILARGPRMRHWARLFAVALAGEGTRVAVLSDESGVVNSEVISTEVDVERMKSGAGIPRCPGSFGGTTVLVLSPNTPSAAVDMWIALEANDPLNKKNRFQRLRIATGEGERSLLRVLTKLQDKGRNNVLIVPATFCADSATMRTLEESVAELDDYMTLHWLPGLGRAFVETLSK